jgi:dolichol-phosphate mannosyltransferase
MSILVCVPTYNEEEAVREIIEQLRAQQLDFVICDGFSKDRTVEIAEAEGVEVLRRAKVGKGHAISLCLEVARDRGYDYMATIDCDLTYSVDDLKSLYQLAEREGYQMVIGSRPFENIAAHRRMANMLVSGYFNLLWRSGVKDIVTGLRIMKVEDFVGRIHANSFDLEPRILAQSVKRKMKIIEVPITYTDRVGESKANLVELARMLWGSTHERFTK